MTKAKKSAKTEKDAGETSVKNNYTQINDFDGIVTHGMHIRNIGVVVRETNTKTGSVSSVFIPGVKIKTKKDWKYVIIDKGPKPKKDKK